ncbi:hypothetical protein V2J09_016284 [Rumex salicifolius]
MSPPIASVSIVDDGVEEVEVEYAVAMEYEGPPVGYEIPRALPIKVDNIPVASVVSHVPFTDKISLPVIQPLLAQDNLNIKFSKELGKVGSDTNVSPTSVMDFERLGEAHACDFKEAELASDVSLSPSSVVGFAEISDSCKDGAVLELSSSGKRDFSDSGGSGVLDVLKSSPGLVSSSLSYQLSEELLGGAASSCTLDFCESFEKSRELSGMSQMLRDSVSFRENPDYDDLNNPEWASSKSGLSLDYSSSAVSSFRTGDCNSMPNCDAKRTTLVTFRDVDSMDCADEELNNIEAHGKKPKKEPRIKSKKGACYRCFKGKRFTEKEVCIVCSAKYCSNCVLRAMGSMPEGRKCVSCIGCPIDEAKRGSLGKCSRLLKRLLNELEIRQIMKAEKLCDVNQLPSEFIAVNGKPLCQEELVTLQNCPIPPKNLKPGNYWYDKVSGLWGKEAQKPYQIISPHLSVGDPIKQDASNGNTQVFINGREITKVELRMLQLAGVQCAGNPHFWVNEDGSYQEEGQKNTKGYIWGKAGTKLVCALLSLPVPSKSKHPYGEQINYVPSKSFPDYFEDKMIQKLLLVGCSGSGTSTIFKQARILHKSEPFSEDERESIKLMIQGNVYTYLGILLEGRDRFEEESWMEIRGKQSSAEYQNEGCADKNKIGTIYSISPRLKSFSDWLLRAMASGDSEAIFPAATREYAPLVEELWNSSAFQATYNRRSELEMLPEASTYFLDRTVDILKADYEPSDLDILYAEGVTSSNGLSCVDFSFPVSATDEYSDATDHYDSMFRYQLIRVQARGLVENCKWLEMFEDVRLVMFSVALSDYDELCIGGDGLPTNKMLIAKKFFESIITHPTFEHMDFLLVLNKYDVFEEKVERVPLSRCEWFEDFQPLISKRQPAHGNSKSINHNPPLGQLASHYVAVKFKRLFSCLTGKKLYVSLVKGLEPNSVDAALRYASEIVKWEDERVIFSSSEYSAYSIEASSPSSH